MRVFGIDPGSVRTGYGCVDTDGTRHRLVSCGAVSGSSRASFPDRLLAIHRGLSKALRAAAPECVAIETLFFARDVRAALKLGHARGVALLAAVEAGLPVVEYSPNEIKSAVTGHGHAEKTQLQHMLKLLLGLDRAPSPHDAADALAVAICHAQMCGPSGRVAPKTPRSQRSWRHVDLRELARRQTQ